MSSTAIYHWPTARTPTPPHRFGSAHASGFNAGFADGSVQTMEYELDAEV
jgi:prepilin-type processing-associated H-X9-DG protein